MTYEKRQRLLENLIYLILWIVVFMMIVFTSRKNEDGKMVVQWNDVFQGLKIIAPIFVIFLVNNYVLIPFLLMRKKLVRYLLAVIVLVLFVFLPIFMSGYPSDSSPLFGQRNRPSPNERTFYNRKKILDEQNFHQPDPRFMRPDRDRTVRRGPNPFFRFMSPFFTFMLMAGFAIGINVAIKLIFQWLQDERKMRLMEKQTLETELEYLKHQINPHFFMNTLNNIHALIDIDTDKAKETVLDLSKMMRYVLYDADQPAVPLEKEIQFLSNYVDLMKLRYTENVDIRISLPTNVPKVQIPPLLFISFLENAFKHGISYQHPSFVELSMTVQKERLQCIVVNSLSNDRAQTSKESGIGLENVRKRLQLLYNNNFTLQIENKEEEYRVLVEIPFNYDDTVHSNR